MKVKIEKEEELEKFVFENLNKYFSEDRIFIESKKKITTKLGVGTLPDGILIDLEKSKVCLIENELISHDVFEHIVKQIIKFLVAYKNEDTKKKLILKLKNLN